MRAFPRPRNGVRTGPSFALRLWENAAVEVLVRMTPAGELMPNPLDKKVHHEVARAVAETAMKQGIARAEYVPYVEG